METLFSAGMLAGSVLLGLWGGTRNKIITMTAAVLGLGLTLVLAGLLPPSGFRAFAGLSLLMGLSAPFFNSVFMALIQTKVEPKYLGRVLGLAGAIMTLASPLGLGLTALFADATGVPLWFLLAGSENHCLRFGTVLLHCQAGPEGVRTYRLDTNTVQISGKWQQYVQFVYHPTVVAIAHGTEKQK